MPTISFNHSAPDKLAAACRLVQERFQEGRSVLVYAPDAQMAARFDQQLWTFAALSFVPHCRAGGKLASETPVLISASTGDGAGRPVLLNLSLEVPPGFEVFEEVIEVVGTAEEDATPARHRFKTYKDRGFPPQAQSCRM